MNTEIGIATITYDTRGKAIKELTNFVPTLNIPITEDMNKQFALIRSEKDEEHLRQNSNLVLAMWFNKVDEIEFADRDNFEIKSEIVECDRYANQTVKRCVIKYSFKEITPSSN